VRAQIAVKVSGDDLDEIRGLADSLRARFAAVPGIADLQVEKQVRIPQLRVVLDYPALAAHAIAPAQVLGVVQRLVGGERVGEVVDGGRRFDLVIRLPDAERDPQRLATLPVATPLGSVPLGQLARIEVGEGPNQIARDRGRRRIVVSANAAGSLSEVVREMRAVVAATPLPAGVTVDIEGQFQAQEEAQTRIAGLAALSLALVFLVLYGRYRSLRLVGMVMVGIPAALVGAVAALALAGQPLSVAALVGFVTLTGIATRNGILKISHYLHLHRRGRGLRRRPGAARRPRAPHPGADDRPHRRAGAGAAALRRRGAGQGDPPPGGGGDLRRPRQLDPARRPAHAAAVPPLWRAGAGVHRFRFFPRRHTMKLNTLILAAAALFAAPAFAHDDATLDAMAAPHGGQLRMSGAWHLELVLAKDARGDAGAGARLSQRPRRQADAGGRRQRQRGAALAGRQAERGAGRGGRPPGGQGPLRRRPRHEGGGDAEVCRRADRDGPLRTLPGQVSRRPLQPRPCHPAAIGYAELNGNDGGGVF
jgi:hypothetical protein